MFTHWQRQKPQFRLLDFPMMTYTVWLGRNRVPNTFFLPEFYSFALFTSGNGWSKRVIIE